ncbi:cytochrome P450 3A15-like [Dreissena polymorpha]|uniref:Cytochrome P450 n=1 Tax=Dreissena polymorpha TaxID=45954 RepID=A0A9D4LC01_DREPO|nr:cytochrome P450 3A15-like [Dreissena polymorpha]XP_052269417.1 cytochrome P450 3A15-like [Dreissena polymorpha]XP_052269418.1 cytochrome P450 3A15-like [Dreissena polymorpha]KAH3855024.1 hypothetical protein DPMN_097583 [Dreissena polymorpha]
MALLQMLARACFTVMCFIQNLLPCIKGRIPEPGRWLHALLDVIHRGENKLFKLESLTDFYHTYGLFRFENKVYIFDPKLTQTVINKLEKGAGDYLENSPLKDTFLGSSSRSPEIRRAIAALFRKSTLEERGGLIIADVDNMCNKIGLEAKEGHVINITDWSLRMAMDVVGHMLLQLDLFAIEGKQEALLECLMTILHRCYALGEITSDSEEFKQANETLQKETTTILEKALQKEDKSTDTRFVIKLHEACGFEQARDNMKLFLMAGSETTASTIPVFCYLMATYARVQDELRQEADENMAALRADPALTLPKMESVLREVLRVYPIAPFISRQTTQQLVVGDVTIGANTDIKAFTWGIHRSSTQWDQSKEFVPFRFLNSGEKSASAMYIPFGAGSRICIGQHLAMLELKLACAIMLNRFKFCKVSETPELRFVTDWAHAVVHPDKDMFFKLEAR